MTNHHQTIEEYSEGGSVDQTDASHLSTSVGHLSLSDAASEDPMDIDPDESLKEQCPAADECPFPGFDSDVSYSPSSPSDSDPLEYDYNTDEQHTHSEYNPEWLADPHRFERSQKRNGLEKTYIILLEGQGNGLRGSARQIRGIFSRNTTWSSIVNQIQATWKEIVDIALTTTDGFVVKSESFRPPVVKELGYVGEALDEECDYPADCDCDACGLLVAGVHAKLRTLTFC